MTNQSPYNQNRSRCAKSQWEVQRYARWVKPEVRSLPYEGNSGWVWLAGVSRALHSRSDSKLHNPCTGFEPNSISDLNTVRTQGRASEHSDGYWIFNSWRLEVHVQFPELTWSDLLQLQLARLIPQRLPSASAISAHCSSLWMQVGVLTHWNELVMIKGTAWWRKEASVFSLPLLVFEVLSWNLQLVWLGGGCVKGKTHVILLM